VTARARFRPAAPPAGVDGRSVRRWHDLARVAGWLNGMKWREEAGERSSPASSVGSPASSPAFPWSSPAFPWSSPAFP
jgi:hypothetical protein